MTSPTGADLLEARRPRPVFVLGTARSGTTWLANLLASHPAVAAVTSPLHEGVHESHLLSHTRYFFPARLSFADFLARYREEDYFVLTGLDPQALVSRLGDREGALTEHFALLMEEFACACGATWWLEKTPKHTTYWEELHRAYPRARFVAIRRGLAATLRSSLSRFGDPGARRRRQVLRKAMRYAIDEAALDRLGDSPAGERTSVVRYEDLLADPDAVMAVVQGELGLPVRLLRSAFARNSSFGEDRTDPFDLGPAELELAERARSMVHAIPYGFVRRMRHTWDRRRAGGFPKYPAATGACRAGRRSASET